MIMKTAFLAASFLAVLSSLQAQETAKPIVVHETIGDTLDVDERAAYDLFPQMEGFQHAVFYLNDDSTLRVTVRLMRDGAPRDVEIVQYRTLASLREHIEAKRTTVMPQRVDRVILSNGSVLVGIIVEQKPEFIRLRTSALGVVKIMSAEIDHIENGTQSMRDVAMGLFSDPNPTRAFLMPTAQTLPAGQGYIGVFELFLLTVAWAPIDNLLVNGGLLLLPLTDQVYHFGFKFGLGQIATDFGVGIGAQFISVPDEGTIGMGYGVMSFGNVDHKLNLGLGFGFDLEGGYSTDAVILISGDARLSESVKILGEAWIMPEVEFFPLAIGLRFFGRHLSGDIGLVYPIGEDIDSPIGFPVGNLIYSF